MPTFRNHLRNGCRCRGGLPALGGSHAERIPGRLRLLPSAADLRCAVLVDDDIEARIHGNLGRFELERLDGPFIQRLLLMRRFKGEIPILDFGEELLEELVERLRYLALNFVDGLGRDIVLLDARGSGPESTRRFDTDGRGRYAERVADGFHV